MSDKGKFEEGFGAQVVRKEASAETEAAPATLTAKDLADMGITFPTTGVFVPTEADWQAMMDTHGLAFTRRASQ